MSTVAHLASSITVHCWNADRSMLALCPNTSEVWIFTGCKDPDPSKWTRTWTLKEHDMVVSGMDWHPVTNKIVTCSHDRNAFVWSLVPAGSSSAAGSRAAGAAAGAGGSEPAGEWQATVVIAGLDRAALAAKWAPCGRKFALASANKNVVLCWFDAAGNWYINAVCKKEKAKTTAKSAVVSLAWHPNNQALAVASTDYRCRVLLAHLEATDGGAPAAPPFTAPGASVELGDVLAEWEATKAWVNDAQWSPSGAQLAFIGHDGLLHVASFGGADAGVAPTLATVKTSALPGNALLWLSESALVVAGHNMNVDVFKAGAGGKWAFAGAGDVKDTGARTLTSASSFGSAMASFSSRVSKGESAADSSSAASALWTKHQGAITCMQAVSRTPAGAVSSFSTSGLDGRVVVWTMADLNKAIPTLAAA